MTQVHPYQYVFQRYEKKYIMTLPQYSTLLNKIGRQAIMDHYGSHTICNLYFDTEDYRMIQSSIEKPAYKEKIRLRSYGIPKKEDAVFLELKKKFKGVVYKRRISLPLLQAENYVYKNTPPEDRGQIFQEIDWAIHRYRAAPKVFIAYDRTAYSAIENDSLRITFDHSIRYRKTALDLTQGSDGEYILDPGKILMEIKIPGALPLWLSHILSELGLFPVSFSKYGSCYQNYICQKNLSGGVICA